APENKSVLGSSRQNASPTQLPRFGNKLEIFARYVWVRLTTLYGLRPGCGSRPLAFDVCAVGDPRGREYERNQGEKMATASDVIAKIKKEGIEFVDVRFTDTKGKEQHVTSPVNQVDDKFFKEGKMFDGSSIAGWKGIQESDMILMPDPDSAVLDPFAKFKQLNITADVIEPADMKGYDRCPRSIAKRALEHLNESGVGDTAYFGPENEFFIFDSMEYEVSMGSQFFKITSEEAAWSTGVEGFHGHSPGVKGGYFPVPPVDTLNDIRAEMCKVIAQVGMVPEVHHHEVANAGQCEIGVGVGTLVRKADEVQMLKYVVHNVARKWGKTATFMPKPLVGDNGNGMHVHQSIFKGGQNLFAGNWH